MTSEHEISITYRQLVNHTVFLLSRPEHPRPKMPLCELVALIFDRNPEEVVVDVDNALAKRWKSGEEGKTPTKK